LPLSHRIIQIERERDTCLGAKEKLHAHTIFEIIFEQRRGERSERDIPNYAESMPTSCIKS
jgi:hypothetical protein